MIIIIVTSIQMQLRGYLTRFLVEPSTGVFVGHVSARVRGKLWAKVEECMGVGKATLVYTTDNEQGYSISYLNRSDREMVDLDGVEVPAVVSDKKESEPRQGWSKAFRYRRYGGRRS